MPGQLQSIVQGLVEAHSDKRLFKKASPVPTVHGMQLMTSNYYFLREQRRTPVYPGWRRRKIRANLSRLRTNYNEDSLSTWGRASRAPMY